MSNMGFVFRAAPGVSIDSGIAKINDALSWDDTEPMTDEIAHSFTSQTNARIQYRVCLNMRGR